MPHIIRSKIEDALLSATQVNSGLAVGGESEHTVVSEPPGGRHGCDVGRGVRVGGADYNDGSAPVEDCWGDGLVNCE